MRKIKFRAWNETRKEYCYSSSWDHLSAFFSMYEQTCIFEQFTGLHDKNGKEIYEGDVVRYESDEENAIAIVSSYYGNNLYFCWQNIPDAPTNTDIFGCKEELEVIGNIHENPDLLEAVK